MGTGHRLHRTVDPVRHPLALGRVRHLIEPIEQEQQVATRHQPLPEAGLDVASPG